MSAWPENLTRPAHRSDDRTSSAILHIVVVSLALLSMSQLSGAGAVDADGDRADRLFLRQLTERQFFGLAEQHCVQQMMRAPDVDQQARWQLRLCQTHQQHAWFAAAVDRDDLLNRSLEQLTDFLKDNVPSPARQFELRLQQARILGQSIQMRIYLSEAGHLFGHRNGMEITVAPLPAAPRPDPSLISVANKGIAIAESLLEQLDQIRKDLEPEMVRKFRGEGRLALAELYSLKWQLQLASPDFAGDADDTLRQAKMLLNLTSRTVGTVGTKLRARWLAAELALKAGDTVEFDLRASALRPSSARDRPTALLQVRALLHQQEATEALRLLSTSHDATALASQQLAWLQLEALLGRIELVSQLNDPSLLAEATAAFRTAHRKLEPLIRGIFINCVERTVQRFHLVSEVGADIANLVEQVEFVRATKDSAAALRLIEVAISRLPTTNHDRPRAALLLRAGEFLIEERKWTQAHEHLSRSATLYERMGASSRWAAADLLRIFTLAQLSTRNDPAVTSQEYIAAIEQHLATFAQQPTARRARQWLLQHIRSDDPLRAAMLVLDMLNDAENTDRELELLLDCGRLLAVAASQSRQSDRRDALHMFSEHANEITARSDDLEQSDMAALQLRVLSFTVAEQPPGSLDWNNVDSRLNQLRDRLPLSVLSQDVELFEQFAVLDAVTAARTGSPEPRLKTAMKNLLTLPMASVAHAITFLHSQFVNDDSVVGDVWLARTTGTLGRHLLKNEEPNLTAQTVLLVLPAVVSASNITGQHEVQDEILAAVTERAFDNSILIRIADMLSTADIGQQRTTAISPGVQRFWLKIIASNPSGSDSWLEASFQLAKISALQDQHDAARRRLGVVQALYPDWGSAARKHRATELRKQLRE
ncbi:MAG TPA: hypothetical protein EYG03_21025 [Planctomycetes bacterium]|nr:hypothetical protein [Fuerstiella sp.]HIK94435.1 hypothetical protein [Planctomycetota bacterium]